MSPLSLSQIAKNQYAGVAVVEDDILFALYRLIEGGLSGEEDLAKAESAIRAVVLNRVACPLNPLFPIDSFGPLLTEMDDVSVSSSDAEIIPRDLRSHVPGILSDFMMESRKELSRIRREAVANGTARRMTEEERTNSEARSGNAFFQMGVERIWYQIDVDLSGVQREMIRRLDQAGRLIGGYVGGASMFASERTSQPSAKEYWSYVAKPLTELDRWYDTYTQMGLDPDERPYIYVPPLLSIILKRASSRSDIAHRIKELRDECEGEVDRMIFALSKLGEAKTTKDTEDARDELIAFSKQLSHLLGVETSRRAYIRNLSLECLSLLAGATAALAGSSQGPLTAVAMGIAAGKAVNVTAQVIPAMSRRLINPSLADDFYRELRPMKDEDSMALVKKHLSEEVLDSFRDK